MTKKEFDVHNFYKGEKFEHVKTKEVGEVVEVDFDSCFIQLKIKGEKEPQQFNYQNLIPIKTK